ncbi:MAG: helix-turn-helix transcriptional regulator [Anaerolineaceae bacterium]|nr:helix-turn-helix transcriptional regulator [Anaerolineaceae bacterium]
MLDYSPFWKTCKEKGISQYDLINMGVQRSVLQRIRECKNMTLYTMEQLCTLLECTPNDIVTFTKDE